MLERDFKEIAREVRLWGKYKKFKRNFKEQIKVNNLVFKNTFYFVHILLNHVVS